MTKKFEWNDELVLAFAKFTYVDSPTMQGRYSDLEQFKSSHASTLSEGGDWEIQCLVVGDRNYWVGKDGLYHTYLLEPRCSLENIMSLHNFKHIHSVRRKSDNEVFSIQDKILYPHEKGHGDFVFIIDFFTIKDNIIFINHHCQGDASVRISDWIKAPQETKQVLTTEDGVKVFDNAGHGMRIVYGLLTKGSWEEKEWVAVELMRFKKSGHWKFFSTKEARASYLLHNKPCLSVSEIIAASEHGIAENNNWPQDVICKISITKLKDLASKRVGGDKI